MFETWDMLTGAPVLYLAIILAVTIYILKNPAMIDTLREIIALLDTNGGHILTLGGFVWFGWHVFGKDQTAGGQIITGAWAALLVLLNVRREKPPGATSQIDTTTVVSEKVPATTTTMKTETTTEPPPPTEDAHP